jgi:transposase
MEREEKLTRKIKRLLRQIGAPRFLHHFGPKKYELKQHLFALLTAQIFKLSLRRVEKLMKMFGNKVPTFSALCKSRKKIPFWIWNKLILSTTELNHETVAIDATGFSKTNPSFHFVKRIDRKNPVKSYAKMSMLFDINKNKIIAIRARVKPAHDIRDVKFLVGKAKIKTLLADKAYDAEWLHEYCFEKNIKTIIPKKKNTKKGFYRRKQRKNYSDEIYGKRNLIEAGFSAMKRKYGGSVSGKGLRAINSELVCKAVAYNLELKH